MGAGQGDSPQTADGDQPDGPVDHTVPVLAIERRDERWGLVFGYACHNTTLPATFVSYHGD